MTGPVEQTLGANDQPARVTTGSSSKAVPTNVTSLTGFLRQVENALSRSDSTRDAAIVNESQNDGLDNEVAGAQEDETAPVQPTLKKRRTTPANTGRKGSEQSSTHTYDDDDDDALEK